MAKQLNLNLNLDTWDDEAREAVQSHLDSIPNKTTLTPRECKDILGSSEMHIRNLVDAGALHGHTINSQDDAKHKHLRIFSLSLRRFIVRRAEVEHLFPELFTQKSKEHS